MRTISQGHKVHQCSVFHVKCCWQKALQSGRISNITVYKDLDTRYKQTKKLKQITYDNVIRRKVRVYNPISSSTC